MEKHTSKPTTVPPGHDAVFCERIRRGPDGRWNVVVETWWGDRASRRLILGPSPANHGA